MGRYRKAATGDLVNDMFFNAPDFLTTVRRLLDAKTEMEFEVFLEKSIQIDKRATVMFLRKYKNEISENNWELAKIHLSKYLDRENVQ